MKSRIKTKFLVFIALFTLVVNVFTSFGSVFVQAKTTASGYKIDVSYRNGTAYLTGNSSEVLQGYKLTSLVDESTGQSYDPNAFSMQVLQNGTYNFVLNYTLNGISTQTQSERVEVVVDKLASGNAKNVTNTGAMPLSALTTQTSVTDVPVELYAYENYDTTTPTKIGNTTIVSGLFADNIDAINAAIKSSLSEQRSYVIGTLYRASDHSEIPIYGIWSHVNSDGSVEYYYSATKDTGSNENSAISIAYKANSGDKFRLYCKLDSPQMRKLDTTSLNSGKLTGMSYNISPDPKNTSGQIAVGSKVILSFTWPVSVDNVEITVAGTQVQTTGNYNKRTRHYEGTFTMPNQDTSIVAKVTSKQSVRWIGVYDSSTTTFLPFEIGWTKVTVDSPTLSSGHTTQAWSTVKKSAGLNNDGYAKVPIIRDFEKYNDLGGKAIAQTYLSTSAGSRTQSGDRVSGYLSSNDNTTVDYPVQDYSVGNDIVVNYESKRGRGHSLSNTISWWNSGGDENKEFNYTFPKVGRIDIYPQQQKQDTDQYKKGFTTESFLYFQSKEFYDAQKEQHPEWFDAEYESGTSQAEKAGFYPVATKLDNGIVVVCYPQQYNTAAPFDEKDYVKDKYSWDKDERGAYYQDLVGVYYNVKIVIKNAYDDVRIVTGKGTSTANNWYYLSSYNNSGIEDVKGSGDSATSNLDPSKAPTIQGGTSFTGGQKNAPTFAVSGKGNQQYTYFKVKPKDGYSVPQPTVDGMPFNGTPYHSSEVISLKNSSQASQDEYNKTAFIEGILGKSPSFYNDGYFNYSLFIKDGNGANHEVSFKSELIKFGVTYDKLSIPEQTGYNAESKRYFSLPLGIPKDENGNSFNGWKLTAVSSDGKTKVPLTNVGTDGKTTDVFKPGDLVDVVNIYNQMKQQLGVQAIGISQYTLQFTADMKKLDPPLSGTAYVNQKLQTSVNSYADSVTESASANGLKTAITALKDSSFQISGISSNYVYNGKSYSMNTVKTDTSKFFVSSFDPNKTSTLADVYYDKDIKVIYSKGDGTGTPPEDKAVYTTNSGSSNPSKITVASGNGLTMPNKKFVGWRIQINGKTGSNVYAPDSTIDLSSLNEGTDSNALRQAIFDAGSVTLVAQYQDQVAEIQSTGTNKHEQIDMASPGYENSPQGKWIYVGGGETGRNDKHFTISGKFKYANKDNTSYQNAIKEHSIYYALYKQNPTEQGKESTNNYELWKASNTNGSNSGNVVDVTFSPSLDKNGYFTVTAEIQSNSKNDSITYRWDNDAKYRIFCWSSANGVNGATFTQDGKVTDSGKSISTSMNFDALPSYTTKTRVLEPFKMANSQSNAIVSKKLMYDTEKGSISFNFTTEHGETLTKDELTQETAIVLAKVEPNGGDPKVWYIKNASGITGSYNGFTNEAGGGGRGVKANTPTLSISSSNAGMFTISVTGISDNLTGSYHGYASGAKYILYVWNKSNSKIPEFTSRGTGSLTNYNINNSANIDVPNYTLNPYIIDGQSSSSQENEGKAYNGVITYPTNARLEKKDNGNVETNKLSVKLHGVWTNASGKPGQEFDPSKDLIQHDYSYQVNIITGGDTVVSENDTQITLAQKGVAGGKSFTADVLKNGTSKLTKGNLGTLNFAANGDPVTSLDFKVIGKAPEFSSKDRFSGTMQYDFIKQPVNKGGG